MRSILMKIAVAIGLAGAVAAPASAQFQSEGYKFLKAVRDQDAAKAKDMFDKPGSTVVNAKDYNTGESAMHIVVKRRDVAWINFLSNAGADMNIRDSDGRTPLIIAAQIGFLDGARVLLYHGADVNADDSKGQTPLIMAVQAHDLPMVRLLVENGADPAQPDRLTGMSAHDYAQRDGRSAAMLKVMEGAKPRKKASSQIFGPRL